MHAIHMPTISNAQEHLQRDAQFAISKKKVLLHSTQPNFKKFFSQTVKANRPEIETSTYCYIKKI